MLTRTQATRTNLATLIFALGKIVHSAGFNYFATEKFVHYLCKTDDPKDVEKIATETMIALAILASAGTNLFVFIPAFYRMLAPSEPTKELAIQATPRMAEKLISTPLRISAWTFGTMTGVLAYFLTQQLSRHIATLMGTNDDAVWKSAVIDVSALMVASIVLLKYAAYDIKICKKNADRIAHGILTKEIPINKAMSITIPITLVTLAIYPMKAYFFAKPAMGSLPLIGPSEAAVNTLTAITCGATLVTSTTWMPSVYDFFNSSPQTVQAQRHVSPPGFIGQALKIAAYTFGFYDASIQGMAAFMGMITVAEELFDSNPYTFWLIALATLAMVNAAIIYAAFSVVPGVEDTLRDCNAKLHSVSLFKPKPLPLNYDSNEEIKSNYTPLPDSV